MALAPTYKAAVLFDLDGTLIDTAADFIAIINTMRAEDQLPALAPNTIRNTVSDGARALVNLAYDLQEGEPGFEEKRQRLLTRYEKELGNDARLFPGFEALLQRFEDNNIGWGIVTNKPAQFTEALLQRLNVQPSNGVAICPDHVQHAKPDPEAIFLAMQRLGVDANNCIYVGDHLRDIAAAKAANVSSIACAYGYIKDSDDIYDWQADIVVDSVAELETQIFQLLPKP